MVKVAHYLSFTVRIVIGFLVLTGLIAAVPAVLKAIDGETCFWVVLGLIFLFGVMQAMLMSTMFGFAAILPVRYIQVTREIFKAKNVAFSRWLACWLAGRLVPVG